MYPGLLGSSTVLMVHEMDGMSIKGKLTEICPKWLVLLFMLIFTVLKLIVCNG